MLALIDVDLVTIAAEKGLFNFKVLARSCLVDLAGSKLEDIVTELFLALGS